jgi:hypothetical protein
MCAPLVVEPLADALGPRGVASAEPGRAFAATALRRPLSASEYAAPDIVTTTEFFPPPFDSIRAGPPRFKPDMRMSPPITRAVAALITFTAASPARAVSMSSSLSTRSSA